MRPKMYCAVAGVAMLLAACAGAPAVPDGKSRVPVNRMARSEKRPQASTESRLRGEDIAPETLHIKFVLKEVPAVATVEEAPATAAPAGK